MYTGPLNTVVGASEGHPTDILVGKAFSLEVVAFGAWLMIIICHPPPPNEA